MLTSRLKSISLASAAIALAALAVAAPAQAQSGSYHPGYKGPTVNEPGVMCRTVLVRVCTTHNGRTYCKPTWQTICREAQAY